MINAMAAEGMDRKKKSQGINNNGIEIGVRIFQPQPQQQELWIVKYFCNAMYAQVRFCVHVVVSLSAGWGAHLTFYTRT